MKGSCKSTFVYCLVLVLAVTACKKSPATAPTDPKPIDSTPAKSDMDFYLTTGDQTSLLKKQNSKLVFGTATNFYPDINVDSTQTYQSVDGFGFCLTDASAGLISDLPSSMQNDLLKELFGSDSNSISISYLRVSIGASDLSASVYTYDDMPAGQSDINLQNFSLRKDQSKVIPILKAILAINPAIKILLSVDSSSFPLGNGPKLHEIWHSGYYPIVWTNTKYKMIYFNMGHNDMDYDGGTNRTLSSTFSSPEQNKMFIDALLWLGSNKK